MKKFFMCLILALSITSCGLLFKSKKDKEPENFYMRTLIEGMFSYTQLDSLCVADNISSQIPDWNKMLFIDGETGQPYEQYLYMLTIKDTTFIYNVIPIKDSVFVQKRIQIEN